MYGRDDTKIVVYSMGRCTKKGIEREKSGIFDEKTVNSCNFVEKQDNII